MNKKLITLIAPLMVISAINAKSMHTDILKLALDITTNIKIQQEEIEAQIEASTKKKNEQEETLQNKMLGLANFKDNSDITLKGPIIIDGATVLKASLSEHNELIQKKNYLDLLQAANKEVAHIYTYKNARHIKRKRSSQEISEKMNSRANESLLGYQNNCMHTHIPRSQCEQLGADIKELLIKPMAALLSNTKLKKETENAMDLSLTIAADPTIVKN